MERAQGHVVRAIRHQPQYDETGTQRVANSPDNRGLTTECGSFGGLRPAPVSLLLFPRGGRKRHRNYRRPWIVLSPWTPIGLPNEGLRTVKLDTVVSILETMGDNNAEQNQ